MVESAEGGQGDTGADNGDEGSGGSFLDGITNEELKGHEAIKGFESLDAFAEDYVKVKDSMQTPEKAEDYVIADEFKELFTDETAVNSFRTTALEMGLSQTQYDSLMKFEASRAAEWAKDATEKQAAARKELTDQYGDKVGEKIKSALRVLTVTDSMDLSGRVDLDHDPGFLKFVVKISELISEDKLETGGTGSGDSRPRMADGSPMLKFPSMES